MDYEATIASPDPKPIASPAPSSEKVAEALAGKPPEKALEPAKPEAPKEQDSQRFAILARREKDIVKKGQALQAERSAFEAEKAEFEAWKKTKQEDDGLWEKQPLEAIKKRGWDYGKLTDMVLNGEKPTPAMEARLAAKEELDSFKKEQAEAARKAAESEASEAQKNYDQAVSAWGEGFKGFVTEKKDEYELSALYPAEATAIAKSMMEQHFEETQRVLSNSEAAQLVEKHFEAELEKITATKKFSAKANPQPKAEEKPPIEAAKPRPTINNNMTPSAPVSKPALSREERIKRAMALQIS